MTRSMLVLIVAGCFGLASAQNATVAAVWQRSYRVWFTRSFGDDHLCLTEIKFFDSSGAAMKGAFKSQSSCYGCSSCETCQHRYGNPLVQFDGEGNDTSEDAWSCTAPGTFVNSLGSQNVIFTLAARPAKLVLARPSIDGDWVAKDWSMEEQQNDGTWWIIAQVTDGPKALEQAVDIPLAGGQPLYDTVDLGPGWTYDNPAAWVTSYPTCGGSEQSPIVIEAKEVAGPVEGGTPLAYMYESLSMRALFNTGLGVQVAGNFGNLTLPGGIYDVKQFHIHMPGEHKIMREGVADPTVGELNIVHQKQGSRGTDDLVMVAIPLRLPREHEELVGTEPWFMSLGLDRIPTDGGHTLPFNFSLNLSAFDAHLQSSFYAYQGSVTTPPCTENVQWYVMEKSAVISGSNVMAYKERFPSPMNSRPQQPIGSRKPARNTLLPYRAAEVTDE